MTLTEAGCHKQCTMNIGILTWTRTTLTTTTSGCLFALPSTTSSRKHTPFDSSWCCFFSPPFFFSGLLYLSTSGEDFEGGELHFFDSSHSSLDCSPMEHPSEPGPCLVTGPPSLVVEPRAGRVIVFGSGRENPHKVTRVTGGTRYVLSFWFTCDSRREMHSFLDGKMHVRFGGTEKGPLGSEL
jgi:hypothetical protein